MSCADRNAGRKFSHRLGGGRNARRAKGVAGSGANCLLSAASGPLSRNDRVRDMIRQGAYGLLIVLAAAASQHEVLFAQGIGAAATNRGWLREAGDFIDALRTIESSARQQLLLFDESGMAPSFLNALRGLGVPLGISEQSGRGIPFRGDAAACMAGWYGASIEELVPCWYSQREAYRAITRAIESLPVSSTYLSQQLSANVAPGINPAAPATPAQPNAASPTTGCCCCPSTDTKTSTVPISTPVLAVGSQTLVRSATVSEDVPIYTGLFVSTNLANEAIGELLGKLFASTALISYLSNDISLDLVIPTAGDAAGQVMTGLSVGFGSFGLGEAQMYTGGFIRGQPPDLLDAALRNRRFAVDSADSYTTLGWRLTIFPGPPDLAGDGNRSTDAAIRAKLQEYRRIPSDGDWRAIGRQFAEWLIWSANVTDADARRWLTEWNARLEPLTDQDLDVVTGPPFGDEEISPTHACLSGIHFPSTREARANLIATIANCFESPEHSGPMVAALRRAIVTWDSTNPFVQPSPLTDADLSSILMEVRAFRSRRPSLWRHFFLSFEVSGMLVASGTPGSVLKRVVSFSDPKFGKTGRAQIAVGIGFWFWTKGS